MLPQAAMFGFPEGSNFHCFALFYLLLLVFKLNVYNTGLQLQKQYNLKAYSKSNQASKMEFFVKIAYGCSCQLFLQKAQFQMIEQVVNSSL